VQNKSEGEHATLASSAAAKVDGHAGGRTVGHPESPTSGGPETIQPPSTPQDARALHCTSGSSPNSQRSDRSKTQGAPGSGNSDGHVPGSVAHGFPASTDPIVAAPPTSGVAGRRAPVVLPKLAGAGPVEHPMKSTAASSPNPLRRTPPV